jgi:hypothetical protein
MAESIAAAKILAVVGLAAVAAGCASSPLIGPQTPGITLTKIGDMTRGGAFSLSPDGTRAAFDSEGLNVLTLGRGSPTKVRDEAPLTLAWSPDGQRLAAVFGEATASAIVVFDEQGTQEAATISLETAVTEIAWRSDDELIAMSLELETLTFGANARGRVIRWIVGQQPTQEEAFDNTLTPRTSAMSHELLCSLLGFALSPLGDELVYTRLHDPPNAVLSLKIVLRHLETGAERVLQEVALTSAGARLSADGEHGVFADGRGTVALRNLWTDAPKQTWSLPGQRLGLATSRDVAVIDGHVFVDGAELLQLEAASRASLSHDATTVLVANSGELFVLRGIEAQPVEVVPADSRDRLIALRKLRSEELITLDEYLAARTRLLEDETVGEPKEDDPAVEEQGGPVQPAEGQDEDAGGREAVEPDPVEPAIEPQGD